MEAKSLIYSAGREIPSHSAIPELPAECEGRGVGWGVARHALPCPQAEHSTFLFGSPPGAHSFIHKSSLGIYWGWTVWGLP